MKTRFYSLLLLLLVMMLAACGGEEQPEEIPPAATEQEAAETGQEQAEAPDTTEQITPEPLEGDPAPAPTAEPDAAQPVAAEPAPPVTIELLLQFQHTEVGPLSQVFLDLTGLDPAPGGKTYAVWLTDENGQYTLLGGAAAGQSFTYSDPDGRNLLSLYGGAAISLEAPANVAAGGLAAPTDLVSSGAIPAGIIGLVRQLSVAAEDTPDFKGYAPGLKEQADFAATHSELALDSIAGGDHAVANLHLEHVNNILVGSESPDFGDLTGDGDPQNPGDGYGVLTYAFETAVTAGTIAEPSMPDYIREAGAAIVTCAANISDIWGPEALSQIREGLSAANAGTAEGPVLALSKVTSAISGGVDADNSGTIDIAKDECGVAQIYEQSQRLFSIPMSVTGAAQPAAGTVADAPVDPTEATAPAAGESPVPITVSMLDFEFSEAQVSIPTGSTVTWSNDGAAPHSATAVDGSFDTGIYDAGQSESITFDNPGTFAYYCSLHGTPDGTGGMVGTIVVEP